MGILNGRKDFAKPFIIPVEREDIRVDNCPDTMFGKTAERRKQIFEELLPAGHGKDSHVLPSLVAEIGSERIEKLSRYDLLRIFRGLRNGN